MAIVARRSQKKCKLQQSVTYEQMSEFLDCFLRVFSQSPTRSPIEMFWAAKSKLFSRKWKESRAQRAPGINQAAERTNNHQCSQNFNKNMLRYECTKAHRKYLPLDNV